MASKRSTPKRNKKLTIILGGMAGSGKSSASEMLSKRFGMCRVSAGDMVRKVAKKMKMNLIEFGRYAEKHPAFDRKLDLQLLAEARKGKCIIDSRTTAYLTKKRGVPALRIFLAVDPMTSARRVSKRDGISIRKALLISDLREKEIARRLKALFGLDTRDTSHYDVVIQTDGYSPEEVADLIANLITYERH